MSKFSKLVQKQKEKQQVKKTNFNLEAITNSNREGVTCFCGSKKSYNTCCKVVHQNILSANTPLDLMRSRYAAYVLGDINYLMESHHSSTRPLQEKDEILEWTKSIQWNGLEVIKTEEELELNVGYVTFIAHYTENGIKNKIQEKSRFVKENNHWVYIDGKHF